MPDMAVLRHVCCGRVTSFRTNQPVHWPAFPKVRIEVSAKLAVTSCTSFLRLRFAVKAVHEGLLAGLGIPYRLGLISGKLFAYCFCGKVSYTLSGCERIFPWTNQRTQ